MWEIGQTNSIWSHWLVGKYDGNKCCEIEAWNTLSKRVNKVVPNFKLCVNKSISGVGKACVNDARFKSHA